MRRVCRARQSDRGPGSCGSRGPIGRSRTPWGQTPASRRAVQTALPLRVLTIGLLVIAAQGSGRAAPALPPLQLQAPFRCQGTALVPLTALQPPPLLEIRYASPYNFMQEVLYPRPQALLRCPVALALQQVQRDLAAEGLGLKVWDAYRPPAVQQRMWERIRDPRYVSDPAQNGGRHTRGTAVDVTLVDRRGRPLAMPTDFDDFSERAHGEASGIPAEAAAHSRRLREAMQRRGFLALASEWWHFDWRDWTSLPPIGDGNGGPP